MTVDSIQVIPGWYGKLPSLGDFASRRLGGDFISAWDAWLQEVIQATRSTSCEDWLDYYLTMPIWRFVLLPGLIGSNGWAGVFMPSVDRVGRQFPLTLVAAISSYTAVAHAVFHGAEWFEGLEATALSVLDRTRGPEELDQSLVDRGFTAPQAADLTAPDGRTLRSLSSAGEGFALVAQTEALRAWARDSGWSGLWWTRGRVDGDPLMLTCAALPTAEEFGWLLQSRLFPTGLDDTT